VAFLADAYSSGLAQGSTSLSGRDQARKLSCSPDHARNVDGFLCPVHRASSRLWDVFSAFATRRIEHGLSTAYRCWLLDGTRFIFRLDGGFHCSGRRARSRMDTVSTVKRSRLGWAWTGARNRFMAGEHWPFLFVITDERRGICSDNGSTSSSRHDLAAHAAHMLELVCYVTLDPACVWYPAGCGGSADARSSCRNKLLYSRRIACYR